MPKFIAVMSYKSTFKNIYPENIAPNPKKTKGINITNGDSWVSFIEIFLLL